MSLRVEQIQGSEGFAAIQESWQALHEQISPRTPFTTPLWNTLWWKHYRSQRFAVRDELFAHVIKDETNRLLAVAPMMITERPSIGPLRARTLQCFGTDRNITEIRGPIYRADNQARVLQALTQHFAQHQDRWDWLDWGLLREDNWTDDVQLLTPPVISDHLLIDYQLSLPATWEEFRATRSRNIKESLRKCHNSLKRAGFAAELHMVQQPEDCAPALQTFLRLHADRGQAVGTVRHPDVFRREQDRAFLIEYVQEAAKIGQLRIFQLRISGNVVATRIAFLLGDELFLYYSGYDTKWAKFSVMTTLVAEVLKWSIEQGIKTVNLSTGTDVSKLRWNPTPVAFRSAIQVAPKWQARMAFGAHRFARSCQDRSAFKTLLATVRR